MELRIDLFAIFIFLGIVQAGFLCLFFFSKEHRRHEANILYGVLLLSIALCNLEILLMYTGYIAKVLHLVDFSEPISFLIGPSFYLMVLAISRGKLKRWHYLHLAFAIVYLISVVPFFLASEDVKYNSWIESYQLPLDYRTTTEGDPRWFWITEHHTELTLASIIIYAILSLVEVIRAFRIRRESFFSTQVPALISLRTGTYHIAVAIILTIVIKLLHKNDTGDHIFAAYMAVGIYLTSFRVMKQSGFFATATAYPTEKPKPIVADEQQDLILLRLKSLMTEKKPYLKPDFSLPDLAQSLGTTVHALSYVINTRTGKSFFELTAEYRVDHAKRLLLEQKNIKVEEIAEQVGYNSRSSFNNAFKRFTGKTPSEFRAEN